MPEVTTQIHSEFISILQEMQQEVIPMLQENLVIQGYQYTNNLYSNIRFHLAEPTPNKWEVILTIPEYGRYLDKKRPFAAYASPQDLAKWITAQGLHNFTSIPGYERSQFIPAKAAERIAWAIKGSKSKVNARYRKFNDPFQWQWFYRPFFGMWAEKRDEMLQVFFTDVPDSIVNEVRNTYQQSLQAAAGRRKVRVR